MPRLGVAILAATLLAPLPAAAQNELSVLSGLESMSSDTAGTSLEPDRFGLTFNRFWTENWSTELGIFRSRETFLTFPDPSNLFESSLMRRTTYPVTGLVQYHFFDSRWRPYVGAGLVYAEIPDNLGDDLVRKDALRPLWNVGVTYQWTPRWGLRFDVKHSPHGIQGPEIFDGWTPTVGVKMRF